ATVGGELLVGRGAVVDGDDREQDGAVRLERGRGVRRGHLVLLGRFVPDEDDALPGTGSQPDVGSERVDDGVDPGLRATVGQQPGGCGGDVVEVVGGRHEDPGQVHRSAVAALDRAAEAHDTDLVVELRGQLVGDPHDVLPDPGLDAAHAPGLVDGEDDVPGWQLRGRNLDRVGGGQVVVAAVVRRGQAAVCAEWEEDGRLAVAVRRHGAAGAAEGDGDLLTADRPVLEGVPQLDARSDGPAAGAAGDRVHAEVGRRLFGHHLHRARRLPAVLVGDRQRGGVLPDGVDVRHSHGGLGARLDHVDLAAVAVVPHAAQ